MFKFYLGDELEDSITGFKGVATARIQYLNGCLQYCIQPRSLNENGIPSESRYYDEAQLLLKKAAKTIITEKPGGNQPTPTQCYKPPGE